MESAYALANKELSEIRRKNSDEQQRRENEVRLAAPEFSDIERRLALGGIAVAKCVLEGANIENVKKQIEAAQADKARLLKRLSLPADYLDKIYTCQKCGDTGYDDDGQRCDCLKRMISKYTGINSNLTEVMKSQTFESFDFTLFDSQPDVSGRSVSKLIRHAYKTAVDFSENFEKSHENLYIFGDAGTGKTYLSSCIANKVLSRGFSVYCQSAFQLLDMCEKLKFGRYTEEEEEQAERSVKYAYSVDLLIIDDMGTEFITAYSSAALFDILNSRLNMGRSTIISSNLPITKIDEIYNTRIASRISGEFKIIPFCGADLRRRKKGI